jgi:hypothetical protein
MVFPFILIVPVQYPDMGCEQLQKLKKSNTIMIEIFFITKIIV